MLQDLLLLEESAYDYELAMLIYANKNNFTIMDVPIATIYEEGNKSSHFRPIIDSLKIYFVFLRFSINSIFTAIVDYTVFALTYFISSNILASFILSRIFSCSFNFYFGKFSVFKSKKPARSEFIKYIGLVILHMLTTYYTVNIILNSYEINIIVAKAFVELSLFLISFLIQRLFIFKL
jgi:hypothetical protein